MRECSAWSASDGRRVRGTRAGVRAVLAPARTVGASVERGGTFELCSQRLPIVTGHNGSGRHGGILAISPPQPARLLPSFYGNDNAAEIRYIFKPVISAPLAIVRFVGGKAGNVSNNRQRFRQITSLVTVAIISRHRQQRLPRDICLPGAFVDSYEVLFQSDAKGSRQIFQHLRAGNIGGNAKPFRLND